MAIVERIKKTDWRILVGTAITVMWLLTGVFYLAGQPNLFDSPLETLGAFLEGAFAPLAFLWLVLGLFIQQKELADNTEVLRQTSIQSERQTQAIAATELNARQETFFKIADSVKRQLGVISGMLFLSNFAESEWMTDERSRQLWHMLSTGDYEVFEREFLILNQDELGGYQHLFYGTEIRERHSRNFIDTFNRLVNLARNCDVDGIIVASTSQTAHGLFFNLLQNHAPEAGVGLVDASDYQNILNNTREAS